MIGAIFCFTAMTVAVRMLAHKIPVAEQVVFRSLIVLVVLAPWIARARFAALRTQRLRLFLVRAALIGIGTVTWFMGVSEMPLAGAITGKILLRTEAPLTVVFYLNFFIGLFTLIPTVFVWVTPTTADLPAILVIGLSAAAAHTCLTHAFAIADASFLLPLEFLRLPVTGLAAYVLFAEIPDRWTLAGATIIFAGAWYVNLGERRR